MVCTLTDAAELEQVIATDPPGGDERKERQEPQVRWIELAQEEAVGGCKHDAMVVVQEFEQHASVDQGLVPQRHLGHPNLRKE